MRPVNEERWRTPDGRDLFVRWAPPEGPARGRVVVLHGYSEHGGRYLHVLDALRRAGFAVAAPDQQGHGRTGPVLGDLPRGEALVADVRLVLDRLTMLHPEGPAFLLGNSLGGLVALRTLQLAPEGLAGAVLQAPAVEVPRDIPMSVVHTVRVLARVAPRLPVRPFFNPERATRDPAFQAWMATDPHTYKGWVRARTGANTFRLVRQVRDGLATVRVPVLLTVGTDDRRVHPEAVEALAAQLGGPTTLKVFEGLRHEAHQEPERAEVVQAWVDWLVAQAGAC